MYSIFCYTCIDEKSKAVNSISELIEQLKSKFVVVFKH